MISEKIAEKQRQLDEENERMIERWRLEQVTARLQEEIDIRKRVYLYQIKCRTDAAVKIQRAVRAYFRKKNQGIGITQILERKQLDDMMMFDLDNGEEQDSLQRRRSSPKSVGPTHTRRSGHLFYRRLQIETAN